MKSIPCAGSSPNKYVAVMIRSSSFPLRNLEIASFVHLPIALMEKKCYIHEIFLYLPIKKFFSLYIKILCMYLVI